MKFPIIKPSGNLTLILQGESLEDQDTMLIDTHTHLTWDSFKPGFKEVVQRAFDAGIKTVINIGVDLESSLAAAKLECDQLKCYSTIGLHPHEASRLLSPESIHGYIEKLEGIYCQYPEKIIAVGECGLDYYFEGNTDYAPSSLSINQLKELQKDLFLAQIDLAKKLNLPLIIHCREAWDDIFLPKLQGTQGVFHSFTGNWEQARKVSGLGYYLGFTCIITYPKNEYLRQVIKNTPLDKILTETDCPFLPPQSKRGQRNEPANVTEVVKTIAMVKDLTIKEVATQTFQNTSKLFGILSSKS